MSFALICIKPSRTRFSCLGYYFEFFAQTSPKTGNRSASIRVCRVVIRSKQNDLTCYNAIIINRIILVANSVGSPEAPYPSNFLPKLISILLRIFLHGSRATRAHKKHSVSSCLRNSANKTNILKRLHFENRYIICI